MDLSWARGSGPSPSRAGWGLQGRYGSGGLGVSWSAWFGFGDAAEGDFEAEGAELADVVADLPAISARRS